MYFSGYQALMWLISAIDGAYFYLYLNNFGIVESELAVFAAAFGIMALMTALVPRSEVQNTLFSLGVTALSLVFCLYGAIGFYSDFIGIFYVQLPFTVLLFFCARIYGKGKQ